MGVLEDPVDGDFKGGCDPVGQVQGRIVFFGFERVDRLAGDADLLAELLLGPVPLGAEGFEAVFHQCELRMNGETNPQTPQKSGTIRAAETCGALA